MDGLGRNAAEIMLTIRDLGQREIVLRSLASIYPTPPGAWSRACWPASPSWSWSCYRERRCTAPGPRRADRPMIRQRWTGANDDTEV
ncbi:hypothetical protein ACVWWN_005032 [Mycobacterium sp. URHB0021]